MAFPFILFMFVSFSSTPNYDIRFTRSVTRVGRKQLRIDRIIQPMFRITYIIVTSYNINILIAQSVWRVTTRRGSNPGRWREFFLFQNVNSGSGAHPNSYKISTRFIPRCSSWALTPSSVKVKNEWIYTSTPPIIYLMYGQRQFYLTCVKSKDFYQ